MQTHCQRFTWRGPIATRIRELDTSPRITTPAETLAFIKAERAPSRRPARFAWSSAPECGLVKSAHNGEAIWLHRCISEYNQRTTATKGGGKMRLGLFLTTLIGLAGASHISSAADATWAAVGALENGLSTSCGGGSIGTTPEFTSPAYGQVDIKGNTLTFKSPSTVPNHSFTVDLTALQPDGSGRVVGIDKNNREFYLTFDPGSGARTFHMTYRLKACRRVYTPKA